MQRPEPCGRTTSIVLISSLVLGVLLFLVIAIVISRRDSGVNIDCCREPTVSSAGVSPCATKTAHGASSSHDDDDCTVKHSHSMSSNHNEDSCAVKKSNGSFSGTDDCVLTATVESEPVPTTCCVPTSRGITGPLIVVIISGIVIGWAVWYFMLKDSAGGQAHVSFEHVEIAGIAEKTCEKNSCAIPAVRSRTLISRSSTTRPELADAVPSKIGGEISLATGLKPPV